MKSAKIHILDELEEVRLNCQRKIYQNNNQNNLKIIPKDNSNIQIIDRNEIEQIKRTLSTKRSLSNDYYNTDLNSFEFSSKNLFHQFSRKFINSIINEDLIKQTVCKIVGISYHTLLIQNISSILRDSNVSATTISETFNPHQIKLSNPSTLYQTLESEFGQTKLITMTLEKQQFKLLSLKKLYKNYEHKKPIPPGLVILLDPSTFTNSKKYLLKLRYFSSESHCVCIKHIVFWGDGNLYSNHMTTHHSISNSNSNSNSDSYLNSNTSENNNNNNNNNHILNKNNNTNNNTNTTKKNKFNSIEHLDENHKNSLPGYNGRIPIWLPCYEVEVSIEEYTLIVSPIESGIEFTSTHNTKLERGYSNISNISNVSNMSADIHYLSEYSHYNNSTPLKGKNHEDRKKAIQRLYSSLSFTSQDDQQISPQYSPHSSPNNSPKRSPNNTPSKLKQHSRHYFEASQSLPTTPYVNPTRISLNNDNLLLNNTQYTLPRTESNASYSSITVRPHSSPVYFSTFQFQPQSKFSLQIASSTLTTQQSSNYTISFKYFFCSSLQSTLTHLDNITEKCQKEAIGSLTLPGNVPALNIACLYGNIHAVQKLLECGANPNRRCGSTFCTPLHDAITGSNIEIIKLLLSYEALQIITDNNLWTPLHLACYHNSINIVQILLNYNERNRKFACEALRMKDIHGLTPYHLLTSYDCNKNKSHCLRFVLDKFMKEHRIQVKKVKWWNTLSNSIKVRVDGKEKEHRDAIRKYIIKARMKDQAPKDSDYY